jgi:hypothetical protein
VPFVPICFSAKLSDELHDQFFDMLDVNNDGFLTKSELSDLFNAGFAVRGQGLNSWSWAQHS